MNLSEDTKCFVMDLVDKYAKINPLDGFYAIYNYEDVIPEEDIDKLISLICLDEPELLVEATGPDNDSYKSLLESSLLKYLSDSIGKEQEIDFARVYKKGVSKYFSKIISELLEEYTALYNNDKGIFTDELHFRKTFTPSRSEQWRHYG